MKKFVSFCLNSCSKFLLTIPLFISFIGCQKVETGIMVINSGHYMGAFGSPNSIGNSQDSVILTISNGHYFCATNYPFNYGAGKLEVSRSTFNFIDTLFFPIPAIYMTGYVLSGEYSYQYDGENLILEKETDFYNLTYRLKRVR
jgi:hypothetical protein